MALGNTYQSNQGNNRDSMYEPTYYSRLRIKNPVENIGLSFAFWKGTLKISITETGSAQEGRNNELAYIHLSPTKARLLAEGTKRILENSEANNIYGVDTGTGETRGFIAVGRDKGVPFVFIAKVSGKGTYESSQRFNFNVDYNYLLKVHDIVKLSIQKEYQNQLELQQFYDLLQDYARSASGALGASYYDIGRYEATKLSNMVRKIGLKTGALESNYNNGGGNSNSSFFRDADVDYDAPSKSSSQSSKPNFVSVTDLDEYLG